MFNGNDIPHELLLTSRQKTKLRNAFNNNMWTDLKLSRAPISKIIQSGGLLMKVAIPLAPLGITAAASAIHAEIQQQQQQKRWFWNNNFNNFRWRNEWYNKNCSSSWRF